MYSPINLINTKMYKEIDGTTKMKLNITRVKMLTSGDSIQCYKGLGDISIPFPIVNDKVVNIEVMSTVKKLLNNWLTNLSNFSNFNNSKSTTFTGGSPLDNKPLFDIELIKGASKDTPNIMYNAIYPILNHNKDQSTSYMLYSKAVKRYNIRNSMLTDPYKIFGIALAYFNKKPITFSTLLNEIVYPGVIYGAACFRAFVNDFSKTLNNNKYIDIYQETDSFNVLKNNVVYEYLVNYGNKNNTKDSKCALDYIDENKYSFVMYDKSYKLSNGTYESINANIKTFNNEKIRICSDLTIGPSINSTFYINLLKEAKKDKFEDGKGDPKSLRLLYITDFMTSLRHIDSVCTYLSMMSSLIKHVSYYSFEHHTMKPYSNFESFEPFHSENIPFS